jgi:hypothetical protein
LPFFVVIAVAFNLSRGEAFSKARLAAVAGIS